MIEKPVICKTTGRKPSRASEPSAQKQGTEAARGITLCTQRWPSDMNSSPPSLALPTVAAEVALPVARAGLSMNLNFSRLALRAHFERVRHPAWVSAKAMYWHCLAKAGDVT
eukprot:4948532-Pyramimonas_sp.AAC.1